MSEAAAGACRPLVCVYVTDRGFLPCTCFSIRTLVEAATAPLEIYLLHVGITAADLAAARGYLGSMAAKVNYVALDAAEIEGLPNPTKLPKATYGRLLMHRYLPPSLERALYIDGDTLVDIDVAPLADIPLDGVFLRAVLDVGRILVGRREEAQQRLDLGPNGDYFNAGVLLMNWPAWCEAKVGEECLRVLAAEPGRFTQKDQCALNYVCRGRWAPLDLVWNYQPASIFYADRARALFHFLGNRKPWRSGHLRHPMRFAKRYHDLYADSPWSDEFVTPALPYGVAAALRGMKRICSWRNWRDAGRYKRLLATHG